MWAFTRYSQGACAGSRARKQAGKERFAIAVTTTRIGSGSGSRVRSAASQLPSVEMKRRAAVEPVIGHVKAEHRMDRNYLKGRLGDRINAVLAAAGYNFGLLLPWLAELLRIIIRAFFETVPARNIA
jgi:hypothetical protein